MECSHLRDTTLLHIDSIVRDGSTAMANITVRDEGTDLEFPLQPRGFRLLAGIPSIPNAISERLVERFGSLQALMAASLEDLRAVDGVGEARARTVREQLSRMAESSLEKYL